MANSGKLEPTQWGWLVRVHKPGCKVVNPEAPAAKRMEDLVQALLEYDIIKYYLGCGIYEPKNISFTSHDQWQWGV